MAASCYLGRPRDRSGDFPVVVLEPCGLYNFQKAALAFLRDEGDGSSYCRLLNLAPGLGKTVVARRLFATLPEKHTTLYLTPSGLVEQTAQTLRTALGDERRLEVAEANTGEAFRRTCQQEVAADVTVLNVCVRFNFYDFLWHFDLVVVDEAQTRLGICRRLAELHSRLIMLSGAALHMNPLPAQTTAFRVDKATHVVRQAGLPRVSIDVVKAAVEEEALTGYVEALEDEWHHGGCAGAEAASVVYLALHRALEARPILRRAWKPHRRLRFATDILESFRQDHRDQHKDQRKIKAALGNGYIDRLEEILATQPGLPPIGHWMEPATRAALEAAQAGGRRARGGGVARRVREGGEVEVEVEVEVEGGFAGAAWPTSRLSAYACYWHRRALGAREHDGDDRMMMRSVRTALVGRGSCCPRILLRVDDVPRTAALLESEYLDAGVLILPLNTSMSARARERRIVRFKGADQQQCKIQVLRRAAPGAAGALGRVLRMAGGRACIDSLEAFLIQPRILVCDAAGDLGFDLHKSISALVSRVFLHTYSDCLQFLGRASRITAPGGRAGMAAPPSFTLSMPMRECTLEELLFLPQILKEAREAREDHFGAPTAQEHEQHEQPSSSQSSAPKRRRRTSEDDT